MKITIKNRYTGKVLVEGEAENLKEFLEDNASADLIGANLRDADLIGADLRGANLRGAYLRGADLAGAYLMGADLAGANLAGAYLGGAKIKITQAESLLRSTGVIVEGAGK